MQPFRSMNNYLWERNTFYFFIQCHKKCTTHTSNIPQTLTNEMQDISITLNQMQNVFTLQLKKQKF